MSVTVTASNGWVHKPITEADAAAFMMSFRDYPISPGETPISYEERLTRFSESLMVNDVLSGTSTFGGMFEATIGLCSSSTTTLSNS